MNYIYKKYLGGELGGGSGGLEQDSMVLSAQQLVLIFFIGIIYNGKSNTLFFSIVFQLKSLNFDHLSSLRFSVCGIRICSIPICA